MKLLRNKHSVLDCNGKNKYKVGNNNIEVILAAMPKVVKIIAKKENVIHRI